MLKQITLDSSRYSSPARLALTVLALCTAFTLAAAPDAAASADVATDRDVLVAFYQATDGANWENSANWLSDAPLAAWNGVTTDDNGRVIALAFVENGLRGTIPPELGHLANLEVLLLRGNRLSGSIPPELGNLANLRFLVLWENRLRGSIPSELGNLANLEALALGSNELSGSVPPELGKLTNLTQLHLYSNQLSGSIPPELGKLTNLTQLYLHSNRLSGPIPAALGNLINLTELHLYSNQLSGSIPPELGRLTNLTQLYLFLNQLSGTIPPELGNLTSLEWLVLGDNKLSGPIPPELGNLANLEVLLLGNNRLSGSIPSELGNLVNLTELYLRGNELSGCVPEVLRNIEQNDLDSLGLPVCGASSSALVAADREILVALYEAAGGVNWRNNANWLSAAPLNTWHGVTTDSSGRVIELVLAENGLSGEIPSELGNLANLTKLWLYSNQLSGSIPVELGALANLTSLRLFGNQLRGEIPPELGNLTNLERLDLDANELSGSIPPELGQLAKLTWLDLFSNQLSGEIPSELGSLTSLEVLRLFSNQLSGAIPTELGSLTNLTSLFLSENRLSGCLPAVWRSVENNDLDSLDLPFCSAPSATGATDRDLLIALYQATNGANWRNSANWLSDAPLATWHGVTTDGSGRVIELDLLENGLRGEIPTELGQLINLIMLDLAGNQLSETIPSELGELTNLRQLSLGNNDLSGAIPPQLGNLTNLKWLYLHENDLSGSIPSELGRLAGLEALGLWDNALSGAIPPALGQLTNLKQLSLAGNNLSGTIPAELGRLTKLERLVLWDNELRGAIPPALGQLTRLTALYLSGNELSGCVPAVWRNVEENDADDLDLPFCGAATDREALIALYQAANGVNWKNNANWLSAAPLNTWHGVTTDENGRVIGLDLRSNGLSGSIPSQLGNLSSLTRLVLSVNRLRGPIPPELGNLSNLTELGLSNNRLSGDIPPELGNLTNLTRLALSINRLRGPIPPELGNLSNLGKLYLAGNGLSGCVPGELWRNVRSNDLKRLGLPVCPAPSPISTASAESLTSNQVFTKVSPAVAFMETAAAAAAAVLVEGGYLVTNAHAVWPYDAARVVFPDGTEFEQVAVKGWDLLADLAVLGPIDAPVAPVALLDGEKIPIASDVYLVGYPGQVEAVPQPAIARGVLTHLREWEPVGVTYFQTDAAITGGRSGGALVSDTGGVISVSGFRIAEGRFGLAASSTDILPRVRQLIAGQDPAGLGERRLPAAGGELRHELTLRNLWDELGFLINEPAGAEIELELIGENDGGISVFDAVGDELLVLDDERTGAETGSFVAQREGPRFLLAWQLNETAADFTLTASHRLMPLNDPERGRQLQVGQTIRGNIDFPADIDHFLLHLEEDETVEIVARSALADTLLTVDYLGAVGEQVVRDDDSGGGLFGLDARIVYRAPHTGSYFVVVSDVSRAAPGGYTLSVNPADPGDASQQSAPPGFGLAQLRGAFTGLPASYTEIDPALMEISPEDMFDISADAQPDHSDLVGFLTSDESHLIIAASGQLTGAERIAAFDRELSEMEQELLAGSAADIWGGGDPQSVGRLEIPPVGDRSFGLSLEFIEDGAPIRMEMLFFRRGNLLASVITVSFGPHDAQEHVSAEQAARALDAQMGRYLSAEQTR